MPILKKRIIAAVLILTFVTGINASAYSNYCDSSSATALRGDYVSQLKVIGNGFDDTLKAFHAQKAAGHDAPADSGTSEAADDAEQTDYTKQLAQLYTERMTIFNEYSAQTDALEYELAPKLIDYDMLLKKLKRMYEDYKVLKAAAQKAEALFRVGGCELSEAEVCTKETESKFFEIEALLFEISALKAEIEAVTGQPLTSDFDFSQVYLITDAVSLVPEQLSGIVGGATLCIPEGAERHVFEAADVTEQYNNAVKCYYALGGAMREYIAAAEGIRKGEAQLKLGALTAEGYDALVQQKADVYMTASQAKADYAKALIELDKASGGALTRALGISAGRAVTYAAAVSDAKSGSGLWVMGNSAAGIVFTPVSLPYGVDPEKDDTVTYTISYNGTRISGGAVIRPQEYAEGCDHAQITFYINGINAGTYKMDVFSPFGEFIS